MSRKFCFVTSKVSTRCLSYNVKDVDGFKPEDVRGQVKAASINADVTCMWISGDPEE